MVQIKKVEEIIECDCGEFQVHCGWLWCGAVQPDADDHEMNRHSIPSCY